MRRLALLVILTGCGSTIDSDDVFGVGTSMVTTGVGGSDGSTTGEPSGPYECHPIEGGCGTDACVIDISDPKFLCVDRISNVAERDACSEQGECADGMACALLPWHPSLPPQDICARWCYMGVSDWCGGGMRCDPPPYGWSAAGVLDLGLCVLDL